MLAAVLDLAVSFVLFAIALIVSVLVHELGHVVAGWAAGLRVARVMLGPIEIRDHGRPRVRFVPSLQAGVLLVPFDRGAALEPMRWGMIVSTAAGPLVGIASGALLIALAGGLRFGEPPSCFSVGRFRSCPASQSAAARTGDRSGRPAFFSLLMPTESGHILAATLMVGEALSGRAHGMDPDLEGLERAPDEVFAALPVRAATPR